ncbi:MAG: FKBP-type peptidyl-prolyl cis-trans isomerase [bacterium]
MNKVLVGGIVAAVVVLGYVLLTPKSANAPVEKKQAAKSETTEVKKQDAVALTEARPEVKSQSVISNSTNEKKPMELEIKTTKEGTGDRVVKNGDTISVHYTGKLTDGTVFDSSVSRGVPFDFTVGQGMVIQGWEKGFIGAKVGEKRTLTIPSEMGYGARGAGASIPPNATLIFDVELVAIK